MDDLISRQAAKNLLEEWAGGYSYIETPTEQAIEEFQNLPSVQPEIIRCKDCKYRDENWKRVSVRWLPCMDVRTGSNWYCGSAERGEQDE